MKSKFVHGLLSFLVVFFLTFSATSAAEARCRWVPAHTWNGHYVPAHKVCYERKYRHHYRHHNCRWRDGVRYCWR